MDSEIQKTRPCVVMSPDEMNAHLPTVIVAPMTTGSRPARFRIALTFQVVLSAPRRVGKTSLLQRLVREADGHGLLPAFLDVSRRESALDLIGAISEAIPERSIVAHMARAGQRALGSLDRIGRIGRPCTTRTRKPGSLRWLARPRQRADSAGRWWNSNVLRAKSKA